MSSSVTSMTKRTAEAQMNTPYLLGTYLASNKEVKGMRANCVRGARSVREVGEARGRGLTAARERGQCRQ